MVVLFYKGTIASVYDSHWIWADTYHVFEESGKVKHLLCKAVERFGDT